MFGCVVYIKVVKIEVVGESVCQMTKLLLEVKRLLLIIGAAAIDNFQRPFC